MLPWEKPLADIDTDILHYNYCFGCGKENPAGLKMAFDWDGQTASADFTVEEKHQGWPGTMHGGLICAVLDEAVGWAAWYRGIVGVTGKLVARLKRPILTGQTVHIAATVVESSRKLVKARAVITLPDNTEAAEATGTIYVLPRQGNPRRSSVAGGTATPP